MRLIVLLTFISISFNAFSHSQSPITKKEMSMNGRASITITVGNSSEKRTTYQMYINGEKYGDEFKINKKDIKKRNVTIKNLKPDIVETHEICSLSVPEKEEEYITRICTKYKTLYPKTKIKKARERALNK